VEDPTHDLDGVAADGNGADPDAEVPARAAAMKAASKKPATAPADPAGTAGGVATLAAEAPATTETTAGGDDVASAAEGAGKGEEGEGAAEGEGEGTEATAPLPGAFGMERRKAVITVVVGAIAVAFLGWLIGSQIDSPGDVAARSAAPDASPILAPVQEQELSSSVIARGTAGYGKSRPLTLAASALRPDTGVVTFLPTDLNAAIPEGGVLMTHSGRPVFAIQGDTPMYRDLGPGVVGNDVGQLEIALERMGINPGPVDGRYDAATEAAVRTLYANAGFPPIVASQADLDAAGVSASLDPGSRAGPGVQVPANEIFFVGGAPAHIGKVNVKVGEPATADSSAPGGGLMTVSDSTVTIAGSIPVKEAKFLKPGMSVAIDQPDLGIEAKGEITTVAESPGPPAEDQFHVYFEVVLDKAPDGINDQSVRLTVPIKSTKGKALTVPQSALFQAADGTTRIKVMRKGGLTDVTVVPGLQAGGFVVVEPTGKQKLEAGDEVQVGISQSGG